VGRVAICGCRFLNFLNFNNSETLLFDGSVLQVVTFFTVTSRRLSQTYFLSIFFFFSAHTFSKFDVFNSAVETVTVTCVPTFSASRWSPLVALRDSSATLPNTRTLYTGSTGYALLRILAPSALARLGAAIPVQ